MKHFVAQLTEDRHINVKADRMELKDEVILAYDGDTLVAMADVGVVLTAHISEKGDNAPTIPTPEQAEPKEDTTLESPPTKTIPTQEITPKQPQPQQEHRSEPSETGVKGFLYIKCEACGKTRGFCAKTPIKRAACKCGHATELRNLKPLYVNCECGETFKYRTNLTDSIASINCIKCGSPVDLEYHDKKGVYATIKED